MTFRFSVTVALLIALCSPAGAKNYYVAVEGNDQNPGNEDQSFKTIQRAADVMKAGDVCYIGQGVYRESVRLVESGSRDRPIRFVASADAKVIVDGTDVIDAKWSLHKGNIYKTNVRHEVKQLFLDGKMLIEARWPNMEFPRQLWSKEKWATSDVGSRHGRMVDAELSETGIDWTGGIAVLNVAHQFYTWTRPVTNHGKGSATFTYDANLSDFSWRKGKYWAQGLVFEDDCYYLYGKLEALDCEGEWFYDDKSRILYLWAPGGVDPSGHELKFKRRNYGFTATDIEYVQFEGFSFFGTAVCFNNSDNLSIEDCHFLYPCHGRRFHEPGYEEEDTYARIEGNGNTVRRCSFAYGSLTGLHVEGEGNLIENNILHDFGWEVTLKHVPLRVIGAGDDKSKGNVIRNNTVFNSGAPAIHFRGRGTIVEYNHAYNALCGRSGGSKDGSIVYTSSPDCADSVIRYNWVHGAKPPVDVNINWGGGIGIRGDDRTIRLTIHNNVVWNCGGAGILVKGDYNKVFNNTVFDIGRSGKPTGNYIMMKSGPESTAPRHRNSLKKVPHFECENANSEIRNNVALTITSNWKSEEFPAGDNVTSNYRNREIRLMDIDDFDFRPAPGSKLIDAGEHIKGYTNGYKGKAPDIGAYEYGGKRWKAGAEWKEDKRRWTRQ